MLKYDVTDEKLTNVTRNEEENNLSIVNEKVDTGASFGGKEMKALKRSRYNEKKMSYRKSFMLLNKRTNQIVEIRGASSYQACAMIGWKARQVKVLEVKILAQEG